MFFYILLNYAKTIEKECVEKTIMNCKELL